MKWPNSDSARLAMNGGTLSRTCFFLSGVGELLQQLDERSDLKWLGNVAIHTGGDTTLPVAQHRVGRHSDDRQVSAGASFRGPDGSGGLEPVHLRHLHVHQHRVEVGSIEQGQGFAAVRRHRHVVSLFLQHARGDLLVDRVVLRQQNT